MLKSGSLTLVVLGSFLLTIDGVFVGEEDPGFVDAGGVQDLTDAPGGTVRRWSLPALPPAPHRGRAALAAGDAALERSGGNESVGPSYVGTKGCDDFCHPPAERAQALLSGTSSSAGAQFSCRQLLYSYWQRGDTPNISIAIVLVNNHCGGSCACSAWEAKQELPELPQQPSLSAATADPCTSTTQEAAGDVGLSEIGRRVRKPRKRQTGRRDKKRPSLAESYSRTPDSPLGATTGRPLTDLAPFSAAASQALAAGASMSPPGAPSSGDKPSSVLDSPEDRSRRAAPRSFAQRRKGGSRRESGSGDVQRMSHRRDNRRGRGKARNHRGRGEHAATLVGWEMTEQEAHREARRPRSDRDEVVEGSRGRNSEGGPKSTELKKEVLQDLTGAVHDLLNLDSGPSPGPSVYYVHGPPGFESSEGSSKRTNFELEPAADFVNGAHPRKEAGLGFRLA
eukprot:TRINITY_DN14573_c0_g1_i3.p1 TRINITY_DN14573_c0_g1~~TRINITY_DN14573_c0_g1_i3.p1  ORF type:complete len:452 (-),score=58.26 TRINITY_DN14573_c0_g1_i3:44-1399(-)